MRSRRSADQVAEVARRRLELLSAELAEIRSGSAAARGGDPDPVGPGVGGPDCGPLRPSGSGELFRPSAAPGRPGRHAHRPVAAHTALSGWVSDRLPATLQGRVRLAGPHVTVLALVVAAALGVTAWWAARADGPDVTAVSSASAPAASSPTLPALVTPSPAGSGSAAAAAVVAAPSAAPSASATGTVVVDVAGKVRRPGIASLPMGSRVVDAIEAAGGARRGVSLTGLNLARVLVDGEQVVVGVPAPAGAAASAVAAPGGPTPGQLVDLNTAGQPELESLPGVGPVTAQKILTYRQDNGAFTSVDQLLDVSGIGEATLAEMAPFCTI